MRIETILATWAELSFPVDGDYKIGDIVGWVVLRNLYVRDGPPRRQTKFYCGPVIDIECGEGIIPDVVVVRRGANMPFKVPFDRARIL